MEKHELPREKCFALFGDNCNVNKLIADLTKMALLGCRSHGFNLDVEAYNEKTLKSDIETFYLLIVKLKTLKVPLVRRLFCDPNYEPKLVGPDALPCLRDFSR